MSIELERFDDSSLAKADVQAEGAVKAVSFDIDVLLIVTTELSFVWVVFFGVAVDESFDADILFAAPNAVSTLVAEPLFGIVEVSFAVEVLFGIVETSIDAEVCFGSEVDDDLS